MTYGTFMSKKGNSPAQARGYRSNDAEWCNAKTESERLERHFISHRVSSWTAFASSAYCQTAAKTVTSAQSQGGSPRQAQKSSSSFCRTRFVKKLLLFT